MDKLCHCGKTESDCADYTILTLRRLCETQVEMIRRQRDRIDAALAALAHLSGMVGKSDIPDNQKKYIIERIQKESEPLSLGGPGEDSPSPGPIFDLGVREGWKESQ